MRMVQKLEELHNGLLKETANIGSGNASTLLSMLVDKEVNLTASSFEIVSLKDIHQLIIPLKKLVVVQFIPLGGRLEGSVLLVFPREGVFFLLDLMQKKEPGTTRWLSMEKQDMLRKLSSLSMHKSARGFFSSLICYPSEDVFELVFGLAVASGE
jgi:chemotaxis protein CheY-P-specific phosphatase CheC